MAQSCKWNQSLKILIPSWHDFLFSLSNVALLSSKTHAVDLPSFDIWSKNIDSFVLVPVRDHSVRNEDHFVGCAPVALLLLDNSYIKIFVSFVDLCCSSSVRSSSVRSWWFLQVLFPLEKTCGECCAYVVCWVGCWWIVFSSQQNSLGHFDPLSDFLAVFFYLSFIDLQVRVEFCSIRRKYDQYDGSFSLFVCVFRFQQNETVIGIWCTVVVGRLMLSHEIYDKDSNENVGFFCVASVICNLEER